MKKKKKIKSSMKIMFVILSLSVVTGCIWGSWDFFKTNPTERFVSLNLEFTYEGASQNLTPSGEPFSIEGIRRDFIIKEALYRLEYGDSIDVEKLKNSMAITGSFPSDIINRIEKYNSLFDYGTSRDVQQENYYPTVYTITLYDDFSHGMSRLEMSDILKTIAATYKKYFMKEYVYAFSTDEVNSMINVSELDYNQQIEYIKQRLAFLKSYASELYSITPNFMHNNINFKDFTVKCDDLENNYLDGLEAIVIINSYSKNPSRLRNQYKYEIGLLENELEQKNTDVSRIEELINSYEMDDILLIGMGGESVVRLDSNSAKTYEELTGRKIKLTDSIASVNESISGYRRMLNDLGYQALSGERKQSLENDISKIYERYANLEEELKDMILAYNSYLIDDNSITISDVHYFNPVFLSASHIKRMIKYLVITGLIGVALFSLYMIKKEYNKGRFKSPVI